MKLNCAGKKVIRKGNPLFFCMPLWFSSSLPKCVDWTWASSIATSGIRLNWITLYQAENSTHAKEFLIYDSRERIKLMLATIWQGLSNISRSSPCNLYYLWLLRTWKFTNKVWEFKTATWTARFLIRFLPIVRSSKIMISVRRVIILSKRSNMFVHHIHTVHCPPKLETRSAL